MSTFIELSLLIALILMAAKLAGYFSTRLGQPSVLGELLVGILLGPSLLDLMHLPFIHHGEHLGETILELGELGVLLLMFIAGLELHLDELSSNTKVSAFAGIMGVIVPVGLGSVTARAFGLDWNAAIFMGLTLGATSVSISAQTLMEMRKLRTRVGLGLLGAAVFDDIMIILLLSIFLAVFAGGTSLLGILLILGKMIFYLVSAVAFGMYLLPRIVRFNERLPISQRTLSLGIVILLFYGIAAEVVGGMAAITGTFLAGLMFARTPTKEKLMQGISALAYGLFVPIFFVSIGLSVNIRDMSTSAVWLTLAVIAIAIVSKLIGSGLGARWAGFSWRESWQLGAGMISRGEVGLIVANVGIGAGLVSGDVFSAIVGMVLATTIVTPPLLRAMFNEPKETEEVSAS